MVYLQTLCYSNFIQLPKYKETEDKEKSELLMVAYLDQYTFYLTLSQMVQGNSR